MVGWDQDESIIMIDVLDIKTRLRWFGQVEKRNSDTVGKIMLDYPWKEAWRGFMDIVNKDIRV